MKRPLRVGGRHYEWLTSVAKQEDDDGRHQEN